MIFISIERQIIVICVVFYLNKINLLSLTDKIPSTIGDCLHEGNCYKNTVHSNYNGIRQTEVLSNIFFNDIQKICDV